MALSEIQIIVIFCILALGVYLYIRIAQGDIVPWRFKTFFLGGANLGPDLTENNTIGMTFAWSGGTWFFAWLAYQYGPWVLASQLFWCVSIIALGCLLPKIITRIKSRTIHGFLGQYYGRRTQRIAAIATTFGYIINGGFETFWSSLLFAECLGRPDLALPVAIGIAAVVGVYCTIGGYKSNATVDKPHNIIGVASLAGLVLYVTYGLHIGGTFEFAVLLFAGGSGVYILVSLLMYTRTLRLPFSVLNGISVVFAITAFAIIYLLLANGTGQSVAVQSIIANSPAPLFIIVSTVSFQIFFNVIDMQNWQQIAANEDASPREFSSLAWAIVRASLYLFWFPALGGILLGCALRALGTPVTDQSLFPQAFALVGPLQHELLRATMLGVLLLGFISTSMSTVDSLLMSALQTIWYDILRPEQIERLLKTNKQDEQIMIVRRARASLIPICILMTLGFYGLFLIYGGDALLFQPMMYAMPLSLLAPAMFALFLPGGASEEGGRAVFWGVTSAVVAVVVMFIASVIPGQSQAVKDWLPSLMPIVANGLSVAALVIGIISARSRRISPAKS